MKTFLWALLLLPILLFLSPFIFVIGALIFLGLYSVFFAGWVFVGALIIFIIERLNG